MIELKNVSKSFDTAEGKVDALKDVSITIEDGDIYGIIGMSGAGKSTLVRCINMLEKPTSGEVIVNGKRLDTMSPAQLRAARRNITMIFQQFNLLMQRNCLKNVCFPMELAGASKKDAQNRAKELLALVGLPDKAKAYPAQLSGGQQQRVAIARALATNPKVLLCDEATSALDPKTTRQILELIRDINKKLGITVVIITHQMSVVKEVCNHVAILDDGIIAEEGLVSSVFTSPKSEAARHLVFPGGEDMTVSDPLHERRLKLTFLNVAATSIPLVARLATEEGISANVISATTQKLSDEIYGSMLLGIPNSQFDKATAVGTTATIVPLVVAAFPFVARLVESSLREVDPNIIEAAQSMGAKPMQIICKVMIPESIPSLLQNVTIALTTILGYSAMSGIIGGGGLGKVAIDYGYYRYKYLVMYAAVILLIILVQIFQSVGTRLALKSDKRLKK